MKSNPSSNVIRAIVFDCYGVLYLNTKPRGAEQFDSSVAALIQRLRPHYRIGMLSNTERSFLDRFLAEHDARDLFDEVMASSESQYMKPDREIFEEIAARLGVEIEEMLFIDDSSSHTSAAASYGIPSITYRDPVQLRAQLQAQGILEL